jgi:3'-5' exoribonuclease
MSDPASDEASTLTIKRLEELARSEPTGLFVSLHVQVEAVDIKTTKGGDPFAEARLRDAEGALNLRVWSNSPAFDGCRNLRPSAFIEVRGTFRDEGKYGLASQDWQWRALSAEETETLLAGPPELREKQSADLATIQSLCKTIADPRLNALCQRFLEDMGERFQRTAAARTYHHARRGGLVEHVAQMMRAAEALCAVYTHANRDLLLTGVLFHDCGKLWENHYPPKSFAQAYDGLGEMLGHIPIGIELVNKLWQKTMDEGSSAEWRTLEPDSEEVRRHLLHLIASHHGTREFGSPVEPKTPEAFLLHYVDNIDAKLEMLGDVYATAPELAPRTGIFERQRPFTTNLMAPLPTVEPEVEAKPRNDAGTHPEGA